MGGFSEGYTVKNINLIKLKKAIIEFNICNLHVQTVLDRVDHHRKTENETSGWNAPCKIYITREGRGIIVAGWLLILFWGFVHA